jgi:hypothetical protein
MYQHTKKYHSKRQQEVLERTGPPTFPTLFNNAVINLNHLVQKLLRADIQTDIKLNTL